MWLRRHSRCSFSISSSLASRSHRKSASPYQESDYTELLGSRKVWCPKISTIACAKIATEPLKTLRRRFERGVCIHKLKFIYFCYSHPGTEVRREQTKKSNETSLQNRFQDPSKIKKQTETKTTPRCPKTRSGRRLGVYWSLSGRHCRVKGRGG